MSELLPSRQAMKIRASLVDYLTTTFALSDDDARASLERFLDNPDDGVFRGPYLRARVPFRAADEGWRDHLAWYEGHVPYGHQAEAFRRLSSSSYGLQPDGTVKTAPLPTLVVTGTGSGKTESFLYPILDHVLRANAAGDTGLKAIILYPMNALANDQARRLTDLIRGHEALTGVRAAVFTGETAGVPRTRVTADGLITDRGTIRDNPPDILLTNYKMLDQMLLRAADQGVLSAAATSLQYLVLDEFHTYDGAQGTDVAMLLRRLGLALRRLRPADLPPPVGSGPLGDVTTVATSATLGDGTDTSGMRAFAETVFGIPFDESAVVTETRQAVREWRRAVVSAGTPHGGAPLTVTNALAAAIAALPAHIDEADAPQLAASVLATLFTDGDRVDWTTLSDADLLASVASLDLVQTIATRAAHAVSIDDLSDELLPAGLAADETYESRREVRRRFLTRVFAMLSHVRARVGRAALSIDLHLWVRELTRVDRAATSTVKFRWADDGPVLAGELDAEHTWFPAVYCRHCGRSGWGVQLAPMGDLLSTSDEDIRRDHAARDTSSRFRALIHAPAEAEAAAGGIAVEGLTWFDPVQRAFGARPDDDDPTGDAVPVLMLVGEDADDTSRDDVCPACARADGIRFLGSAMATMLSVVVTSLFGDAQLDRAEKKALVFTDSVQDAAHRAGFVQSRAHVFALRNAVRRAVGDDRVSLDALVGRLLDDAADDRDARYRLLAPELVDRDEFGDFWKARTRKAVAAATLKRVTKRLQFDLAMEFGLHSRVGRTLELTGSLAAGVDVTPEKLLKISRAVLRDTPADGLLDPFDPAGLSDETVVRWARGVLERMRERGAIGHEWFDKYIEEDGRRWRVWGGRPRAAGMPAFPPGREAPAFPRVGAHAPGGNDGQRTHLDVVSHAQSWYAVWAHRTLEVPGADGARLTAALLAALERADVLQSRPITGGSATAYLLPADGVVVEPVSSDALDEGRARLVCDVCRSPLGGTAEVLTQLSGAPCFSARCPGFLRPSTYEASNYYRRLYDEGQVRRVVAREHTGLLDAETRLRYEDGFKASIDDPGSPNVLVATPTLEMGIDIGDLSTVILAGLPRSVASYLQRVGRAGRLTGNALNIATVTGRGDQLPRMGDPLSVIDGAVRPPATFLDAQEILQRQYLASLMDRLAPRSATVRTAADVLTSTEPGTYLGDLVTLADSAHAELLAAFLEAFPSLAAPARERLTAWATPTSGVGTSPLAETVRDAVRRWTADVDNLRRRRTEIAEALPELEAAAARGIEDDAKDALRAAQVTYRMLGGQLYNLTSSEYWVAALERFALLPNYTLLDDSVRLDAAVSWIDPDTSEWRDDTHSYERGAAVAIHELAPGSFFYAQGVEIPVDAVDLGPGGEAVEDWSFCGSCGHAVRTVQVSGPACPRCHADGLTDVAQRLRVVELESVSAIARRDETAIGDANDERKRTRFTVQVAADLDDANVVRRWFTPDGLGVTYARDLAIRWINLGKRGPGRDVRIAGEDLQAPLFRVCDTCGKLDSQAGGNSPRDHRSWCKRRNDPAEHSISIALSRTLVTQGAFLRLPPALTIGDGLAAPSLAAAILRALRETMGGDPDHLRIMQVAEPVGGDDPGTTPSLLVHDTVPGGTGYLAELADPAAMHDLLRTAWSIVAECPCRDEERASCHRCLLPYTQPGTTVARASAQQALARILGVVDAQPSDGFEVVEQDPGVEIGESAIEQLFRQKFIERVSAIGGQITEKPGDWGNKVEVRFPNGRIWMLQPQVPLKMTRPDFVLEAFGAAVDPIAIYTDGKRWHAHPQCNRLRDDADKRAAARGLGYRIMALTWSDLNDAPLPADWFDKTWAATVAPSYGLPTAQISRLTDDPMTSLMSWMQDPDSERPRRGHLADALPLMTNSVSTVQSVSGVADTSLARLAASVLRGNVPVHGPKEWVTRHGRLAVAGRLGAKGATDVAVVLDDRDEALVDVEFDRSWRLWLHLSNLLGWGSDTSRSTMTTVTAVDKGSGIGPVDVAVFELQAEWVPLADLSTPTERKVLTRLAQAGLPVPTIGTETKEGLVLSFAWADAGFAIAWGLTDEDLAASAAEGWDVVDGGREDLIAVTREALGGN